MKEPIKKNSCDFKNSKLFVDGGAQCQTGSFHWYCEEGDCAGANEDEIKPY